LRGPKEKEIDSFGPSLSGELRWLAARRYRAYDLWREKPQAEHAPEIIIATE